MTRFKKAHGAYIFHMLCLYILACIAHHSAMAAPQNSLVKNDDKGVMQKLPKLNKNNFEEVKVNPYLFLIPKTYIKQWPPGNEFIELYMKWPDMHKVTVDDKDISQLIHILLATSRHTNITTEAYLSKLRQRIDKGFLTEPVELAKLGLLGYARANSVLPRYEEYQPIKQITMPLGRALFISCNLLPMRTGQPDSRECDFNLMYKKGLKVTVRFYINNLPDWKNIYLSVIQILDSILIDEN